MIEISKCYQPHTLRIHVLISRAIMQIKPRWLFGNSNARKACIKLEFFSILIVCEYVADTIGFTRQTDFTSLW